MSKTKPVPIKEIIEKFLEEKILKKTSTKQTLLENWEKIVPKIAAKFTRPSFVKNGVLTVSVSNSAWLHQLTLNKNQILKNLEKFAGQDKIKEIRFKISRNNVSLSGKQNNG